jgi:RimJ/RimL family protein N-acetyltransferase
VSNGIERTGITAHALGHNGEMPPPSPLPATIRPATMDDLDRLIDLLWTVAAEGLWLGAQIPFDRDARRAGLAALVEGRGGALFVADVASAGQAPDVVGDLSVGLAGYGVADIGMLLDREWRGQGLGTALLEAGLDWAVQAGAHKAFLEVWPHNEAGLALYRKMGFVEEGRKRRHYRRNNGEIWDAILMGRPL